MKRYGYLYEQVYDMDNLRLAHKMARKGKTWYADVRMVDSNPDKYLSRLAKSLKEQTYKTSPYVDFTIIDKGKERDISKLPYYPDRICHWAIMLVLEPIFMKTFISDTYASIPGRGVHLASNRIRKALRDIEGTQYCLKMDIKKYFPSIDHGILKQKLRRKIKDEKMLWLLDEIIDSYNNGIPIGNYLSQYFANFYLSEIDHAIKERLGCKYYWRYMDDMVILSSDKEWLWWCFSYIDSMVNRLNLQMKRNYQVFPVDKRGVDFLGFVHYHGYTMLRKKIAQRIKKKSHELQSRKLVERDRNSVMSYYGWLIHANCKHFIHIYLDNIIRRFDYEITVSHTA